MNPLRRPEVIVLLVLLLAALAWVLFSGGGDATDEDLWVEESASDPEVSAASNVGGVSAPSTTGLAQLHALRLTRDYGNAKLELHLTVKNPSDEPFALLPPKVRLLTGSGTDVPAFFLPFSQPPTLEPRGEVETKLAFWLDPDHLNGSLALVIGDETFAIKSKSEPYDVEVLENSETIELKPADW